MSTLQSYDASVTATATLLAKGSVGLCAVEVENPNTVPVYLQLFSAVAAADVTLGSTTPNSTRLIPAGLGSGDNGVRIIEFADPPRFDPGLVYAITTTRSGSTAAGAVCQVNFDYN